MKKFLLLAAIVLSPMVSPLWAQDSSSTNLALGKKSWANSEDVQDKHFLSHATDGDVDTRYAAAQNADDVEWTLDLGKVTSFNTVEIEWEKAYCHTYSIAVSSDGHNWKDVVKVSGYDNGGVDHAIRSHEFATCQARYIRLRGSNRAIGDRPGSFYEFRVFNKNTGSVVEEPPYGVNLALDKKATATSGNSSANDCLIAHDGAKKEWRWFTEENATQPEWTVDLGDNKVFNTIEISWEQAYARDFKIYISQDATNWEEVLDITGQHLTFKEKVDGDPEPAVVTYHTLKRNARYVKYQCITPDRAQWPSSFYAFRVFNYPTPVGVNLAKGKQVECNLAHDSNEEIDKAFDGDCTTRFSTNNTNGGKTLEFKVDLNEVVDFNTINIDWEADYLKDYKIEVSADNSIWHAVVDVKDQIPAFIGKHGVVSHDFDPIQGRYVKFTGSNCSMNDRAGSIWEFGVYNFPSSQSGENLALGKTATSNFDNDGQLTPDRALDNNIGQVQYATGDGDNKKVEFTDSRYSSPENESSLEWTLDLGKPEYINTVDIEWETAYNKSYTIETSIDGKEWKEAVNVNNVTLAEGTPKHFPASHRFDTRVARYVKLTGASQGNQRNIEKRPGSFWEFRVFNNNSNVADAPKADEGRNIPLGKATTDNNYTNTNNSKDAVDGEATYTRYGATENAYRPYWEVDLGDISKFNTLEVVWQEAHPDRYTITVSNDGLNWMEVYHRDNFDEFPEIGVEGSYTEAIKLNGYVEARFVRMNCIKGHGWWPFSFYEFRASNGPVIENRNMRVHINTWEGPLNDHGSPHYDGNGLTLTYDYENSNDEYDFWYADLNIVPENWDFVTQCQMEIEEKYDIYDDFKTGNLTYGDGSVIGQDKADSRIDLYFDLREGDKWGNITAYSSYLGNSRLKFGIDPIRVWVRGKKNYYKNPFDKYEILLATRSHNFDDLDLTAEASPLDYSDYTITVPRGTQLYQLMKGTLDTGEDLVLTLQKKVSNPGFYQINLGRKVSFAFDQNFVFKAKINTTDKDDALNGTTINDLQFRVTENNADHKNDPYYYGVKSTHGSTSFIPANTEFDRIILYVDNSKATDDPDRYSLQLNDGHDALPYFKEGIRTLHSVPYLKGWCGSGDSNWSNGIAKNEGGNAAVDGGMPAAESDAMTLYWRFSNIDAEGNPLTEADIKAGKKYHPNAFYLDLPGGVVLSKNFNGANGDSFMGDTSHDDAPTSFNLVDEDGYDAATPRQGGQFFYADTWWAANPRVVPENYQESDNWQPDMRYRNGTPGDLAVGETMTCYGITAFRIVGKKYDMYAPEGSEITDGNIWYLYFNTDSEKAGKAELTAPILVNMLEGGKLTMTNPDEYETYEPKDYLTQTWNLTWEDGQGAGHKEMGKKYFNKPAFGTSKEVSGESNPLMLKLSEINDNWEAVYRLSLDNYNPTVERPFEIVSVTNSMYWAPTFSDPKNDKILPAKWTRFYRGSSRQATKMIDDDTTNGVSMDRYASMPYVDDPELNYDRLIISTTADNVRYMLHANVPEITPVVDADYVKHENGLEMEQYPDLIYPNVKLHVETPISAVDLQKDEPLIVSVYLRNPDNDNLGDAKGKTFRYFTEYRIDPKDIEIVDSKPVPAGGAKVFKAMARRVYLKYDEEKDFIYTEKGDDDKTRVVYLDAQGNEVTDLSEKGPLGNYAPCTIAYHDETASTDLFLQPNEIVLEFDYNYAIDPEKASVRTGCFLAGNLVKSKTIHNIDYDYVSQSVALEVPGNEMKPWDYNGDKINVNSGAYMATVNYGPASDGNDMPRVYTLYEYDPQSPAWAVLCAGKLNGLCNEHGIIIPGNEEEVLKLVENEEEQYEAWGQKLSRPVMQEVLVINESDKNSDKVHEGSFDRITDHGTPLSATPGFDPKASYNNVESYLGFVIKMDYTYAYPAGAPIEIEDATSTRARVAHEDAGGKGFEFVSANVDRDAYYLHTASSYASDWARYANSFLDMSTTGVELVTSGNMTVKTAPGILTVGGIDGDCLIFNLGGMQVYNGPAATLKLPAGVYIVTSAQGTAKVIVP